MEMKNSDLQNGDVVELRNGKRYVVCFGVLRCEDGSMFLDEYDEDMTYCDKAYDIVKVSIQQELPFANLNSEQFPDPTIYWGWKRQEIKEVTMDEIEAKFGCKVKIVGKKDE